MKFIEFKHWSGQDAPHIARATISAGERDLLHTYALTYAAVRDEAVDEGPNRVVTGARAVWAQIAMELEHHTLETERAKWSLLQIRLNALCHVIRLAVLGKEFSSKYFPLG